MRLARLKRSHLLLVALLLWRGRRALRLLQLLMARPL
jgi:hypothetical protein